MEHWILANQNSVYSWLRDCKFLELSQWAAVLQVVKCDVLGLVCVLDECFEGLIFIC